MRFAAILALVAIAASVVDASHNSGPKEYTGDKACEKTQDWIDKNQAKVTKYLARTEERQLKYCANFAKKFNSDKYNASRSSDITAEQMCTVLENESTGVDFSDYKGYHLRDIVIDAGCSPDPTTSKTNLYNDVADLDAAMKLMDWIKKKEWAGDTKYKEWLTCSTAAFAAYCP